MASWLADSARDLTGPWACGEHGLDGYEMFGYGPGVIRAREPQNLDGLSSDFFSRSWRNCEDCLDVAWTAVLTM